MIGQSDAPRQDHIECAPRLGGLMLGRVDGFGIACWCLLNCILSLSASTFLGARRFLCRILPFPFFLFSLEGRDGVSLFSLFVHAALARPLVTLFIGIYTYMYMCERSFSLSRGRLCSRVNTAHPRKRQYYRSTSSQLECLLALNMRVRPSRVPIAL